MTHFAGKMVRMLLLSAISTVLLAGFAAAAESQQAVAVGATTGSSLRLRADASTDDVIMEVLKTYEERGEHFDNFCCIYPTAPFVTGERLKQAMELLADSDSVMPVVLFSYPPQRGLLISEEGFLKRQFPEYALARSQDLQKIYHDCGQFYACRTDVFLKEGTTDVKGQVPLVLTEMEVQDIDTLEDWEIAEIKYRRLHSES